MKVKNIVQNAAFIPQIPDFKAKHEAHTQQAKESSTAIYQKSIDLANQINILARTFEQIGQMNRKVNVPTQSRLFIKLSKIFYGQSLALQNTGELIKIYCVQAMKYYKQEYEPLLEIAKFRDQQNAIYL